MPSPTQKKKMSLNCLRILLDAGILNSTNIKYDLIIRKCQEEIFEKDYIALTAVNGKCKYVCMKSSGARLPLVNPEYLS